jgi:serine/threonine-protein kinase
VERILAGRYELEVPLGRGGSGEVWRGRDLASRRPVAIKLVELSAIDDPGLLAETIGRFRREATVVASLHHPNIVGSLDAGRVGNQLFMIMELAPGISLASMMDERGVRGMGLFPVSSVVRIAQETSTGLAAAHAAGVVHRDIKPSNLMVTPQPGVKIIDFGIARLLADNSPRLTLRGHTVGTIAYMSPEQAQGDEVDGRADLYSLGCVLYQLLSGRLPFRSSLPAALLMMQVMDQAIPLTSFRSDLPPGLPELVSDLMEKDRTARPADAAQVISRLVTIGESLGDGEPLQEVDRQTFRPGDLPRPGGETRLDLALPELDRATVLSPGRGLGPPTGPLPGSPPGKPPGPPPALPHGSGPGRLTGPLGRETMEVPPWEVGRAVPAPAPVPYTSLPPAAQLPPAAAPPWPGPPADLRGTGGGVPAWPVEERRPRRRRRWPALLSTLLTIAVAAGVWFYVWDRTHGKLSITQVAVTTPNPSVGCNGTADIIGTITTNGRGGQIQYEWIRGSETGPALVAQAGSASNEVKVSLQWAFHGKGTGKAVAKLLVLTPTRDEASITFPYSCPA